MVALKQIEAVSDYNKKRYTKKLNLLCFYFLLQQWWLCFIFFIS